MGGGGGGGAAAPIGAPHEPQNCAPAVKAALQRGQAVVVTGIAPDRVARRSGERMCANVAALANAREAKKLTRVSWKAKPSHR